MQETTTDVLVVGGGVVGLSVALRMRQAGLSVRVLERGICGREASWAGAGVLSPGSVAKEDDPRAALRRASTDRFESFCAELRELSGIWAEYERCGCLDLITDENQEAAAARELAAARADRLDSARVSRLDGRDLHAFEPELSRRVRSALRVRDAAQVRNPRLLAALLQACLRLGVDVRTQVDVRDFVLRAGRVCGVDAADSRYVSRWVVLAAGAWSSQISARLQGLVDVHPVRGQIVLLEHSPRLFRPIIEHGKCYLVCRNDGYVVVGATEEPEAGFEKRTTAGAVQKLLGLAASFVPRLADATFVRAWSGLRPASHDGRPYLGPVDGLDGLLAATGHYRAGLTLAPITADLLTQFVTTGTTELSFEPFRPGRQQGIDQESGEVVSL